ncbi:MAG: phosphoribosylformylglycinamidine synthase subunit PurL [Anaerolinea sp.]
MNTHRITVASRVPRSLSIADARLAPRIRQITNARIYFIHGSLSAEELRHIANELLADDVVETYMIGLPPAPNGHIIEVTPLPGVTDPVAESLQRALHQFGFHQVMQTATGQRYEIAGELSLDELDQLARGVLSNPVIHRYSLNQPISAPFVEAHAGDGYVEHIELRGLDEAGLLALSKERRLSLDLREMQAVQAHYTAIGRTATDVELEMIAQTWSEHCVHKTFRAVIDFTDEHGQQETIHGLLRTYIRAATEQIAKPWVVSAFVDNAGIIRFNDQFDLAFKVETHNHPSALEPFGGANTGVGGVVRDILGVSARPIANTDVLCFGPTDLPDERLPEGVLPPRRIEQGVIAGIEDYGNKMGIPTVNGAVLYHRGYTANPLVFCGCLGILPRGSHRTEPHKGDLVVVIGGRTGRDGLRGATFSSMEMDTQTSEIASVSVQIGHPINEKQVQEVILRARDEGLYHAITDCGAGGLSSAVGEMGKALGADVELSTVPLKYAGLRPWEIWLSEAQERMVLAVPPAHWARFEAICAGQNVEATCIGTFTGDGVLTLRYEGQVISQMDMHFLHEGIPTRRLTAHWQRPSTNDAPPPADDYNALLLALLAHPNIRSKEPIVRLYDHEVQGGTVVKPYGGTGEHSPNDGAVIVPIATRHQADADGQVRGVALSAGICPQYGDDPYAMAWAAVDEAFRNLAAVGADPDQVAILDNFCWGNPNLPDRLGTLVMTAKGCYDAALAYNAPFISGKDSLNNEYTDEHGQRHAIPGTLLISAVGIVPDVQRTTSTDLKQAGDALYLLGETRAEFGGSHANLVRGLNGGTVPQPNRDPLPLLRQLYQSIRLGCVNACHDLSEGGLPVTLAEMCIGGQLGAVINLPDDPHTLMLSESSSRFVVSVPPDHIAEFEALFAHLPYQRLGMVTQTPALTIQSGETRLVHLSLDELAAAWGVPPKSKPAGVTLPPVATRPSRTHTTTQQPTALILHANGTNRDHDAALALELAGAETRIAHMNEIIAGDVRLRDYQILLLPGGFSYGDDLGAGQLWAVDLRHYLQAEIEAFVAAGKPVLGICNGFQALIKAGLLPDADFAPSTQRRATLTYNEVGHFECRWVELLPVSHSTSLFLDGLSEPIHCPVAHGEGRVVARSEEALNALWNSGQIALQYASEGALADYPANPNGSDWSIAALCNAAGNVMGLMPHPENHIFRWQHPRYHRGEGGHLGLVIFQNAVKFA